jgi:predicted PurR-regulated permease PerM
MARARNTSSPLLTLAALVVAIAALHLAKEILLPVALAILLSFLLTPLANRLERWGFGRVLSVITVVSVSFAALGLLTWVVMSQLVDLGAQLPSYKTTLIRKIEEIRPKSNTFSDITETLEDVQQSIVKEERKAEDKNPAANDDPSKTDIAEAGDDGDKSASEAELSDGSRSLWSWATGFRRPATDKKEPVDVRLVGMPPSPLQQIRDWLGPLVAPLTTAGIAVVLVIFILLKREDQRNRLLQLFGASHLHATTEALTDVTERVSRYLRMQFLINASYGMSVAVGMWLIGVPNAVMWGVLSFALRFLPYIGPWLSAVMPLFVSIATSAGWIQPVLVIAWFTLLELIVNNIAEPLLYGRSTGVSGVGVIVAAIFWTWIWGTIGLVLAMPLTVCTVVLARYIPSLRFLTILLGDQPPMLAEEQIYQRLLAGDGEEARKLVLRRLETSSLVEVYDQVLIPALNLAETDRHAGLLHEVQEEAIEETAQELVEELGEVAQADRAAKAAATATGRAPGTGARVLCIPLRDEADEISAHMLKQLLEIEGFEIELAASESLTGELVGSVESLKVDIAVISILPPLPPRSSRLLCRRLRDRYPELPIIVGYWCGQCAPDLERRLCADAAETVVTLGAAVERVRAIAIRPQIVEKVG